jgi:hypothetical protein
MRTFFFFLLFSGCAHTLHTIYVERDRTVIDEISGAECIRSYSSYDGDLWTDFYGPPCSVFMKQKVKKIQPFGYIEGK